MKALTRWTTGIVGGLVILGIAFLIAFQPLELRRQRTPEGQAASSAVQAALRYAIENEDRLPETLNAEEIRQSVPDWYEGDIPAESVIYLPPEGKALVNTESDTIIVIVPVLGGAHVGYVGGYAAYFSSGTNIRLTTGSQPGHDGNAERPPGDDREQ